ncbi:hypothetical protein BD289DRAFT_133267 [Coniella lustricola]|uniref:Uncharacterized protein n=1 Tax=Coniella lustricola TaxID=2025994 RepID=A0A2T2ZVU1_9PEZI|nr:hypothetical protein BD289DRAFT_133267 [Coniella lustricola]
MLMSFARKKEIMVLWRLCGAYSFPCMSWPGPRRSKGSAQSSGSCLTDWLINWLVQWLDCCILKGPHVHTSPIIPAAGRRPYDSSISFLASD